MSFSVVLATQSPVDFTSLQRKDILMYAHTLCTHTHTHTHTYAHTHTHTHTSTTPLVIQPQPPVIVDAPQDILTELFIPVNFTCMAVGEPRPMYDWFLDDVLIASTDEPQLVRLGLPQDRGKYTCVAHNALGRSELSSPALLTISGWSCSDNHPK